jgi:hypothetical protein
MKRKSTTPRTNADYIQCAAIGPGLFDCDGQIVGNPDGLGRGGPHPD